MVGRFSLGNPQDLPPPYKDPGAPLIVAARETTTTTTTTTTTHFFSLPLWKKRTAPPAPVVRHSVFGVDVTEDGRVHGRERFVVEKDLPPTPPDESVFPVRLSGTNGAVHAHEEDPMMSLFSPSSSRKSFAASQSTTALAHASLGLGLPHAMRDTSASSSSSEINTVAFGTPAVPTSTLRPETHNLRRAKSSRAISAFEPPVAIEISSSEGAKQRSRGVSLGTTTAFLTLGGSDPKGKGKELDEQPARPAPKASLARRASFWSRKKATTMDSSAPLPPRESIPLPSLPSVLPLTPFTIDDLPMSASSSHSRHSPVLSRSYSERAGVPQLPTPTNGSGHRRPHRPSRRPATADSSRRPATADPSARSPSFLDSPLPPPPLPSLPAAKPEIRDPPPESQNLRGPPGRPRAQTNPPLLYRLSMNLFSSSSSPSSSLTHAPNLIHDSPKNSPSRSTSNSPRVSFNKPPSVIPKPEVDHESPEIYLSRLLLAVSKAEVAGILASSADPFHIRALRAYIDNFDFVDDPLDVSLRKLLMHVGLPRETQQIDRVMEAFAGRYLECNPNLFTSDDHPYILAFSLIMLHTDAFNKSNKRKMTKADYIKNTRLPGVPPDVLDCFYDNIVVTPFIFIEDPLDVNGQRGLVSDGPTRTLSMGNPLSASGSGSGTTLLGKVNKVDPYYLIANNMLGPLRVDVDAYVPRENPYSFEGTAGPWDEQDLQLAFAKANVIEVGAAAIGRVPTLFSLGPGGSAPLPLNPTPGFQEITTPSGEVSTLRVTKVGLLNRKDDVLEGGKKSSNRKWKPWSVILTGSQLLLFRDPAWAAGLLAQVESPDAQFIFPQTIFKPDELLSVKDAIAVFDRSYTKYENAFRFVMQDGRQFLLQSSSERELNEWISRINYASTFKTAGVRMRPQGMSGKDVQLTGVAAATSHLHDLQHAQTAHRARKWDHDAPLELMGMLSGEGESPVKRPAAGRRVTMISYRGDMDLDVPTAPEVDGADQFKATFDQVKAELASGNWASVETDSPVVEDFPSISRGPSSHPSYNSRLPSRSHIIQSKVRDLDARISATQTQLNSDLRFVRNIGTLTPFQRATRERLMVSVQGIAKRVMQVRLEITKLSCHREVLSNDLIAEGRDWSRAKKIALQAATETLQIRGDENVPRMTVSVPNNSEPLPDSFHTTPAKSRSSSSHRPDSTCDSFHSALDFSEDTMSSGFLSASVRVDTSSPRSSTTSIQSFAFPDPSSSARQSLGGSPGEGSEGTPGSGTHEKYYTALESPEPAEEWDQTRCAQRVSLVRVPSDIHISTRFSSTRRPNR
ncbi:hypothetical protein B0H17DRAFT_990621 [Mycena rosella]|uniref:Uncharacterized protein n=1 Tax=Mycena rosella TaxID=1033263 RepID=A0AAD7CWB8_MYCRO|nr:hypothetical protein B0H17DRAFT_990621 [Mycena rosella]